jgi:sodium-coupled neutral amino acid transporter 11
VFDYSNLAEKVMGPRGSQIVDVSIVIGAAGSLLSYILIIGTVLTEVVEQCSAWYCNVVFLTILPVSAFTVPLCLLRNFGHLAVASYISITVISASVLLVIIGGPIVNANNSALTYKLGSFLGAIKTVGDIVFALGYITATFHTYNSMEKRTVQNFNAASRNTTIIGAVMCFFTGLAGYLSFGSDTKSNIIENFHGTLGGIFKIALVIHLVLYIPGDFVIMRAAILKLRGVSLSDLSDFQFITLSVSCIGTVTFVALMLQVYLSSTDSLAIVVDITGGVAGSMLYFVIPGLCALQLFKHEQETYVKSLLLLLFGTTIIVLVIISSAL